MYAKVMLASALLLVAAASVAFGEPKDRKGSAGDVYRFVGFATTIPRLGIEGFVALHVSCQEDFGLLARMCTTEEFWLSPNADYPDELAWIHMVGTRSGSLSDFTRGINFNENGSCAGWSNAGDGPAVAPGGQSAGQMSSVPCGVVARPVTCCAPAQ